MVIDVMTIPSDRPGEIFPVSSNSTVSYLKIGMGILLIRSGEFNISLFSPVPKIGLQFSTSGVFIVIFFSVAGVQPGL